MMETTIDSHDTQQRLIQELESSISNWKTALPTATDLYRIGRLLQALSGQQQQLSNVRRAHYDMLSSLPEVYRISLFETLKQALLRVLKQDHDDDTTAESNERIDALGSMSELYQSSSPLAFESWALDDISILVTVYQQSKSSSLQAAMLPVLSHALWSNTVWEELLPAIHLVQDCSLWNDLLEWENDHHPGWKSVLVERYPEHGDYLLSLLDTTTEAPQEDAAVRQVRETLQSAVNDMTVQQQQDEPQPTSPSNELQRRIDSVRQVLPDLGEGFVEICLSYYKGDVEQTVAALVDEEASNLPLQLRLLDRSLPRHVREGSGNDDGDKKARLAAKATLLAVQRQQEDEAYIIDQVMRQDAHDEYNDDYDDQYDDEEGIGNADVGLYDNYDAVRTYNRAMKQVEEDQKFWQENRNTNRDKSPKNTGGEKKYRGPDKMKGGRVPGRGSGRGGRGRGRGGQAKPDTKDNTATPNASNDESGPQKAGEQKKVNVRAKERKLANRKEKQKKAIAKRSG